MNEQAKMLAGKLYTAQDPQLAEEHRRALRLTRRYNMTGEDQTEEREALMQELLGSVGEDVVIMPPFRCDEMRLDKYLKVARILKRRTVSKDLADHQRVLINGKVAKPASEVQVGDLITVIFGQRQLTVRVTETAQYTRKEDAASMYEVVEEKRVELE